MRKSDRRKGRVISYTSGISRFLGRKDDALIASFYYSPGSRHLICCRMSELNTAHDSGAGITDAWADNT